MVRHDQRPGRERHELPRDQKGERIIGEHDEIHAGEKGRIERQHPQRRFFVAPVAEREQACRETSEIDNREKIGGKRVHTEMRAQPRQSERQRQAHRCNCAEQVDDPDRQQ